MMSNVSLWATFSVADHLRRRPFVADVLLYDRLLVPVPDGDDETSRWMRLKRRPDLQKTLLDVLGDLGVPISWSVAHHDRWARQYQGQEASEVASAAVRDDVARAVAFDAQNIENARRGAHAPGASPGDAIDPDDPAFMVTRLVLADEFGSRKDRALLAKIPRVDEVEAVAAYGSYRDFSRERGDLSIADGLPGEPVFAFEWSFFVPSSSTRTDVDLLREAVELAHCDEVIAWRAAIQRWRRDTILRGRSDASAVAEMEGLIADYRRAAKRKGIETRSRWGLAVAGIAAGVAAAFVPPIGVAAAACGVGALIPNRPIPKRLEAAAMFHEARKRFA